VCGWMYIGRQIDSRTDIGYGWMERRTDIFTSTAYNIQQLSNIYGVCVCVCVCVGSFRQQNTKAYGELELQHHTFLSATWILC
jgi:hypothetical protein